MDEAASSTLASAELFRKITEAIGLSVSDREHLDRRGGDRRRRGVVLGGTQQVTASTEQTSAAAHEIASSAADLARTAEELSALTAHFVLSRGGTHGSPGEPPPSGRGREKRLGGDR